MIAAAIPLPLPAASWVSLDIETTDAPESAIQAAISAWKAPSNWKAETVEAKRQDAAIRIREKAALLDASPILCCALITDRGSQLILQGMDDRSYPVDGWTVWAGRDERGLLLLLRNWLDSHTNAGTTIVTHNGGFDLPKIRNAYLRNSLRLPEILRPKLGDEPVPRLVDTMHLIKAFSMEYHDDRYIGLDTVAAILGIQRPKLCMSGADVPKIHQAGRYHEICTYAAIDCATTARAYRLMTGQSDDLA